MKVGLIGNMNNNNFALMRYFRDLGVDAHLLLYSNDGVGALSHFKPESDTWDIEKWRPYIHQTLIPNASVSALKFPLSWLMGYRAMLLTIFGKQKNWVAPISDKTIKKAYAEYDCLIGSGVSPAILKRIGRSLNVFYPYAIGVEYLYSSEFVRHLFNAKMMKKYLYKKIREMQADGISIADNVINMDPGVTKEALLRICVKSINMSLPMCYIDESIPDIPPNKVLADIIPILKASSLNIVHHARLIWNNIDNLPDDDWRLRNKNSDWLLRGIKELIKLRPLEKIRLFILEYGPDIKETKELIKSIGIEEYVTWLPKMERRELMWLLSKVSIIAGEFYSLPRMMWGGTGWEALISGKPLLQGFNFKMGEFEELYGYPPPNMLPVQNKNDIVTHLINCIDFPEKVKSIGIEGEIWFNKYNGIGLAKDWLKLLIKKEECDESSEHC